jgi:CelD/BcsL family acetyltransferase involved in cellulose biosynthesis
VYKVRVAATAQEILELRPVWEELIIDSGCTVFQNFDLNLLAAKMFAGREVPHVICVMDSRGIAIIPAVIRLRDAVIRLLGEELFDYRTFLHVGDQEALRTALAELAKLKMPLDIIAMRERAIRGASGLSFTPFAGAPVVRCSDTDADQFNRTHHRLPRNLSRLSARGYEIRRYDGENPQLLREIYELKARQDPKSLFRDRERVEFMVNAALLQPELFEIFTLEREGQLGAALVTLCDGNIRRLYTGWFAPDLAKHSPALCLIHYVTCEALQQGMDCDYMTGEQPYKLRLATGSHPLYRLQATPQELAQFSKLEQQIGPLTALGLTSA